MTELNFIALTRLNPVDDLPEALAEPCLCVTAAQAVTLDQRGPLISIVSVNVQTGCR